MYHPNACFQLFSITNNHYVTYLASRSHVYVNVAMNRNKEFPQKKTSFAGAATWSKCMRCCDEGYEEPRKATCAARLPTPKRLKTADQALAYLRERSDREAELRREELALRRDELELALRRDELELALRREELELALRRDELELAL